MMAYCSLHGTAPTTSYFSHVAGASSQPRLRPSPPIRQLVSVTSVLSCCSQQMNNSSLRCKLMEQTFIWHHSCTSLTVCRQPI